MRGKQRFGYKKFCRFSDGRISFWVMTIFKTRVTLFVVRFLKLKTNIVVSNQLIKRSFCQLQFYHAAIKHHDNGRTKSTKNQLQSNGEISGMSICFITTQSTHHILHEIFFAFGLFCHFSYRPKTARTFCQTFFNSCVDAKSFSRTFSYANLNIEREIFIS